MKCFKSFVLALIVLFAAFAFAEKKEDWVAITPEYLQLKEVPGSPGASAIQLYYADFINHAAREEFIHICIKVLNDKGKGYADVEIPANEGLGLKDLKARTIHPDGSIVEFTGKPYKKTILKGRGIKLQVKTFTLPDVSVGSIIEYKYKFTWEGSLSSDDWILQHDLFTVKEEFSFKPSAYYTPYTFSPGQIAWVSPKDVPVRKVKGDSAELEMENVPAFEAEDHMPPEENYKPSVRFFYIDSGIRTADKYWEDTGKLVYQFLADYIGNHKEVKEAAAQAIGSETDPEKKLRLLYARAQQIRNLSFERERTLEEQKKEHIKENEGIAQVLKRGYGDRSDINFLFVGMARAAGFEASPVLVSSREERFFAKEVLSLRQVDSEIAQVKLNGADIYLDPGTKYCPFGMLRWMQTSTTALKPEKKGASFVVTPSFSQDQAITRRSAKLTLDEGGTAKGEITVQFQGLEALEHRLAAVDSDDAGKKKDLEDELQAWLPPGALVKFQDAKGWESADEPLTVTFNVEIPSYGSVTGKRLLVPSYLFPPKQKDAFTHADRKYPLYFPYAFTELDIVNIKVPPGFSIETVPSQQDAKLPYAAYRSTSIVKDNQLRTERELLFNAIFVNMSKYPEVKDFFSKVHAGDEQQVVLRTGEAATAQR